METLKLNRTADVSTMKSSLLDFVNRNNRLALPGVPFNLVSKDKSESKVCAHPFDLVCVFENMEVDDIEVSYNERGIINIRTA
jgi:hypothetical protein